MVLKTLTWNGQLQTNANVLQNELYRENDDNIYILM